jgi:integrase
MATPGIIVRHSRACPSRDGGACTKARANGCRPSFEAWVWDPRDKRKVRRTFDDAKAAKTWLHDATVARNRGTLRVPTRQTLTAAAEAFIEGMKKGSITTRSQKRYKPSVIRGYQADLERYVIPELGDIRLADVRRRDLQALVDRLVDDGHSGSKVRNVLTPVQTIYRRAVKREEITVSPAADLDLPPVGEPRDRVASPAEAERLLTALPEDDQAPWAAAFFAGLRRGELRGLRCDDVDLDAGKISVRRGWDDYEGAIDPKSKKGSRDVPIPAVLAKHLRAHMLRSGRRGTDLIFGSTATTPFTPKVLRTRAAGAWAATVVGAFFTGRSVELEPIMLHECRHTYVSLMHAAGCSLEEIGDYVGHSSAYMTDRYRHLLPGQHKVAADRLNDYLRGAHSGAQAT